MIELRNISKSYMTAHGRRYIFRDLSLTIPSGKNVALIGRNGAGKSTLMRLLGGLDTPDKGRIICDRSISWPVGLSGGFQGSLTGRQNVKFVCRVHGAHGNAMRQVIQYVEDFAEIGEYFDLPVKSYSSGMRARLAFGMSLAFDFDYYLVDEAFSVGDAHFRAKAVKEFKAKVASANLVFVSHDIGQIKNMCDIVLLVQDGRIGQFDDVETGIAAYQSGK